MQSTAHTAFIWQEPKKVFLPHSCEHCSEEASCDIMTADGKWEMLCMSCVGELPLGTIRGGYVIEVIHRCKA